MVRVGIYRYMFAFFAPNFGAQVFFLDCSFSTLISSFYFVVLRSLPPAVIALGLLLKEGQQGNRPWRWTRIPGLLPAAFVLPSLTASSGPSSIGKPDEGSSAALRLPLIPSDARPSPAPFESAPSTSLHDDFLAQHIAAKSAAAPILEHLGLSGPDFDRAASLVWSRTFVHPSDGRLYMVPGADLANHNRDANLEASLFSV